MNSLGTIAQAQFWYSALSWTNSLSVYERIDYAQYCIQESAAASLGDFEKLSQLWKRSSEITVA